MSAQTKIDTKLKSDAMDIFKAALDAADPAGAVRQSVSLEDETIKVRQGKKVIKAIKLNRVERIFVVGAGKASAAMAKVLEDILEDRISGGVISVKTGHSLALKYIKVVEAAHPVPDMNGVKAATQIKGLLEDADSKDLVFSVISGGGSALLPLPASGIKLTEKQEVTRLLLGCGADIHEINVVRKHLSLTKGGQMARLASPATVINLMLSDVVGNDMDTIASGPFVPDRSTFEEVALILAKYKLVKKVPSSIRTHLKKGLTGQIDETPKEDNPAFAKVTNLVLGSNFISLQAAEAKAKSIGYKPLILSSSIVGETREIARMHAAIAEEVQATKHPVPPPLCLISGGETTVTMNTSGKGGRNQEFVLAAALDIDGMDDVLVFSAGTDGTDGPTDAAGAVADGSTCQRAAAFNLSPQKHLQEHNAYPFFKKLGDLIMTGPTLTNVMDVRLVLVR